MEETTAHIDYLGIASRHRKIILVSFIAFVIITFVFTKLAPKVYRASTTLFVYQDWSGDEAIKPAQLAAGMVTPTAPDYILALLKSDDLARLVISELKLEQDPRFTNPKKRHTPESF